MRSIVRFVSIVALTFGLLASATSCATAKTGKRITGECKNHYGHFEGVATIYHDKFDGRYTACGVRFKQNEISAAIKATVRTRVFGKSSAFCDNLYALVTVKRTGEQFTIPVNDTGGMPRAVIDLSEKAADEMRIRSLDEVEFELCRD